ncbi:hypothetical protein E2562_007670 [Oryza meyeriana var. granulata]|uniref:Pentatricopeptide repeat-containing protein n=1 Tax=Oryza meyeriana var. granulata TaxID=110450 RepID=A0A6G1DW08_9ORYZ|nr:hypothetical protein E2562_007670 [Oryza meyeriana var. granulata]
MIRSGFYPNEFALATVLTACQSMAHVSKLLISLSLHGIAVKVGLDGNPFVGSSLLLMSLVNGCRIHGNKKLGVVAAEKILSMAPSSEGAYVSLSNVYADDGEWHSAKGTRKRMVQNQVQKVQGYSRIEI